METKTIIIDYIQKEFVKGGKYRIAADEDLLSSGILDSLGILRLVSFVEQQFKRNIPVEDIVYENFCSVEALTNYLGTK